ncbi:MAG: ferritin-like domain-containing protein [Parachlamydiaceae bacterium]|nr:ferritin-like domain-containing protein [Parachlamydiaceae bacterium]
MKNNELFNLFMDELKDMLSTENQIIAALPKMIKLASINELKEALTNHLEETKGQVTRLKTIFSILGEKPTEITCEGMQGILAEGDEIVKGKTKSSLLDAAIISAAQKVEHYEIASYGTLRSFAKQLELDSEIAKLLQASLDEEGAADKKLTKIADGSFFTTGVNKVAAGK